jgi:hypothetical protein
LKNESAKCKARVLVYEIRRYKDEKQEFWFMKYGVIKDKKSCFALRNTALLKIKKVVLV